MDSRKVIKIKKSLYVNIPLDAVRGLGIRKGDRLKVVSLPGYGIVITQGEGIGKDLVHPESVQKRKRAVGITYTQLEKKLMTFGSDLLSYAVSRVIPAIATSSVVDLNSRVERLERKAGVSDQQAG